MVRLLKIAGLKRVIKNNTLGSRLFSDLAEVSATLKMYPLAMKCYLKSDKTLKAKNKFLWEYHSLWDSTEFNHLLLIDSQTLSSSQKLTVVDSPPVSLENIEQSFSDGKTAAAYAILVHVKQPRRGKRKAFTGINNVGHTFITLVKYNTDNSSVSRSFGYYPAKNHLLSATPLHPGDQAVFKDDARHEWDEVVGKFISEEQFGHIIGIMNRYNRKKYNLNNNNCTDFGLTVAISAGLQIDHTSGRWPLGKGNNPANAGQSLLENKFTDNDSSNAQTLLINSPLFLNN